MGDEQKPAEPVDLAARVAALEALVKALVDALAPHLDLQA